jgi:hypothetical protein
VKPTLTASKSKTDWARLANSEKPGTPTVEHPEADIKHVVCAVVRDGLRPVPSKALGWPPAQA